VIATAGAVVLACLSSAGGASAARQLDLVVKSPNRGGIELVRAKRSVRFSSGNILQGPFLTTSGRPLEIWAHRLTPGAPAVAQTVDRSSGQPVATTVPGLEVTLDKGLADFLTYRIKDSKGNVVIESTGPFCPNGSGNQTDSSTFQAAGLPGGNARRRPMLPSWWNSGMFCGEEQADSLVWLSGPNNPVFYPGERSISLPDGEYTYEATINPNGVLDEKTLANNHFSQRFKLKTDRALWRKLFIGPGRRSDSREVRGIGTRLLGRGAGRPTVRPPRASQIDGAPGALPDPMALPASRFEYSRRGSRAEISFSSIVSNAGEAPIMLFGKRRDSAGTTMPGWQYTKGADGRLVRRKTNGFVWDQRDSHLHWHYNKLAVYELLSMDGKVLRRSDKVGFCFMPTTLLRFEPVRGPVGQGAPLWYNNPNQRVDCGMRRSKRVAMSLAAGWGDEYYQSIAGQSLDVSDLAPGSYRLRITVNPQGDLAESDPLNNVSERLIKLAGSGDGRTLTVPRQGIVSPEFHPLRKSRWNFGPVGASVSSYGGKPNPLTARLLCGLRGAVR